MAATLATLSYQIILVLETRSDVSEGFSMTWVSKYQILIFYLLTVRAELLIYRPIPDCG